MNNSEKLISWLKYLDVEYLDDSASNALSKLNINNAGDHEEIINIAMRNEVNSLSEVSRLSMLKVLEELSGYPVLTLIAPQEKAPLRQGRQRGWWGSAEG